MATIRDVLEYGRRGVTIFRVDNPHTKAYPFWAWLIGEVRACIRRRIPRRGVPRPKRMYALAKRASISPLDFTWRNDNPSLNVLPRTLDRRP